MAIIQAFAILSITSPYIVLSDRPSLDIDLSHSSNADARVVRLHTSGHISAKEGGALSGDAECTAISGTCMHITKCGGKAGCTTVKGKCSGGSANRCCIRTGTYSDPPCSELGGTCIDESTCGSGRVISDKCMNFGQTIKCCLSAGSHNLPTVSNDDLISDEEAVAVCKDAFKQISFKDGVKVRQQCESASFLNEYLRQVKREHPATFWASETISGAEDLIDLKHQAEKANRKLWGVGAKCVRPKNTPEIWDALTPKTCGVLLQECMDKISLARLPCYNAAMSMLEFKEKVEGGAADAITALKITKTTSFVVSGTILTVLTAGGATTALGHVGVTNAMATTVLASGAGGAVGASTFTFVEMTASQFGEKMAGLRRDFDWRSIRSACMQQAVTGFVAGGLAKPLATWASPSIGKAVVAQLAKFPGTAAAKRVLGQTMSKMLAEGSERAIGGAAWNGIVTAIVEAWTLATDETSHKCFDACRTIPMTDDSAEFQHKCEIVGKTRRKDGTLESSSPGGCRVVGSGSSMKCRQRVHDSCHVSGSSWQNDCLKKSGCSVGSESQFLCKLAASLIQGAVAGVIFDNDYTLATGGKAGGGFQYIGRAQVGEVKGLLGLINVELGTAGAAQTDTFFACR